MRIVTFAALLSAAAVAAAQAPQESHELAIWEAYQSFRDADSYVFEMKGAETYGKRTVPVHAFLYFRRSVDARTRTDSRAQVELDVYDATPTGEQISLRIVGDGTNLYRYDIARREVSTTTYGFYGDRAPANYVGSDVPRLIGQLRAATPGLASYLSRLLSEVNPAGPAYLAKFNTWTPGMRALAFDEVPLGVRELNGPISADDTVTDPITGRRFMRGSDRFVFFGFDRPASDRTVAFSLYDADESDGSERWEVRTVNVALRSPDRYAYLEIAPKIGDAPEWAFVPYVGAQGAQFRPANGGR